MPETTNTRTVFRLSREEYDKLEAKLPQPHVGKETSGEQASYLLGIQYVLGLIRRGYVIE